MRGERRGMAGTPRTRAVSILNCFLTQAPFLRPRHSMLAAIGLTHIYRRTMECDDLRIVLLC